MKRTKGFVILYRMRKNDGCLTVCPSQYIDRPWVKNCLHLLYQQTKIFSNGKTFSKLSFSTPPFHFEILPASEMFLRATCNLDWFHLKNKNKVQYHHRKCNLLFIPEIVPDCTCRRQPRRSRTGGHRAATRSPGRGSPSKISSWSPFPFHLFILGFCFAYRLATVVLLVQPHPRLFSLLVVDDGGVVSKVKSVALLVQHEGVGVVKEGLRGRDWKTF